MSVPGDLRFRARLLAFAFLALVLPRVVVDMVLPVVKGCAARRQGEPSRAWSQFIFRLGSDPTTAARRLSANS
jgi:hypothetical protein